tara:strand:+ start:1226 stop:1819 length:594 start_codon:yes stop_codon:yes gene_type:complete
MAYLGTQPNDVKKNIGLYTPSEILQLKKEGSWGGSLEHISTTTFSSSSAVNITEGFTGYDVFFAQVIGLTGSTNMNFGMQFYESGVLETAGVYQYAQQFIQTDGGNGEEKSTTATRLFMNSFQSTDSCGMYIYFYNFTDSSKYSFYTFQTTPSYVADFEVKFGGGVLPQASVVDGISFTPNTGTMSGSIKLYGVKQI